MPLSPSGVYTLPSGYLAVTGQDILPSQHNPPLEDIAAVLSEAFYRTGIAPMLADLNMNTFKVVGLANGTAPTDAVNKSQIDSIGPIGSMVAWPAVSPPAGWLLCYGQAISRTTFSALFAVVGTVYGAGDGSTTFNVPDMRGRVPAGKDNMGGVAAGRLPGLVVGSVVGNALGNFGGQESHVLTDAEMPNHTHSVNDPGHLHAYGRPVAFLDNDRGTQGSLWSIDSSETVNTNAAVTGISLNPAGSDGGHNTIQPTIITSWIIRTGV